MNNKPLKSLRQVALEYSDDLSTSNFKERIWRLTMPVSFRKILPNSNDDDHNSQKLPSHDILFNLSINYLEIWEIFRLVKSCKFCYWALLHDEELFWRQIAKRDGFIDLNDISTIGVDCAKIYCNLWASCLEFETLSCSAFVESNLFSMKSISDNYQLFLKFKKRISEDFNRYMVVMRSERKKRFFIQKYLVAFGFLRLNVGMEMKESYQRTLLSLFQTLIFAEDGSVFEAGLDYQKVTSHNLLGLAFDTLFENLDEPFKHQVEISFIKNVAFKIPSPKTLTSTTFYDRAMEIIGRKFEENYDWNNYYELFIDLLKHPNGKLKTSNGFVLIFNCFISCTIQRENAIQVILELLKSNNQVENTPYYELVCKNVKWFHPAIFDELMNEKFYSSGCKEYYIESLLNYIETNEPLDLSIRKRALEKVFFVCNDPKVQLLESIPIRLLKSIEKNHGLELNFETNQFEDCLFNAWKKFNLFHDSQMLKDLYERNQQRTLDQFFELKLNPKTEPSIVSEIFEILTAHGNKLVETELESQTFHWKFTELFVDYCLRGEYQDTTDIQLLYRYLSMKYPNGITSMLQALAHSEKKSQEKATKKPKPFKK